MANYWVISIGINQYRHLQPLMHAQNDARFVHRFFTEEAGIPADHCVLLSDLATSVGEQVVYPDKPAIAAWLQTITHQVKADDVVWFFFSGYGAQANDLSSHTNGQKESHSIDYLMPIDGDPGKIESTGIAAADLINTLADLPTDKTLLILDINRSQGALAGQTIGTQVIDLAQKRQVATLLSCQPEQYSHETLGVRHGLFTAALLEALRQDCKTAGQISSYLNQRLPELCEHHWRPAQNPVSILTEQQQGAEVVPELSHTILAHGPTADASDRLSDESAVGAQRAIATDSVATAAAIATGRPAAATNAGTTATDIKNRPTPSQEPLVVQPPHVQPPHTEETGSTENYRSRRSDEIEDASAVSGTQLRNWGLLALAILMGLVLLKQPFVKAAWDRLTEKIETAIASKPSNLKDPASGATSTNDAVGTGTASTASEGSAPEQTATAAAGPNTQFLDSGAETPGQKPAPPLAGQSTGQSADQLTGQPTAKSPAATETEKASAQTLMSQAKAALDKKQYSEALIALQQVPKSQRDEKFSAVLIQARAGAAKAQQTNASVLTEARTSIQPTQASQFTEAIAKARRIQPGEPYYEAAQQDIRGWSQVILDIAEGRATSGNLDGAIAAAGVMPYANAEYHQKAMDRITFWQQRQQSRQIIADAQKIPKLGQASSYQQGIVKLREVPIEHPEYEVAQRLADQWSESIFSIAQARAAQNRESAAIQAAVLVPAGTTAYEPTQQAIRRWRSEEVEGVESEKSDELGE